MTKEEEFDYIQEVIDQEIDSHSLNLNLLLEQKRNFPIRSSISHNISFVEGIVYSLKELKKVIEEKRYREVLHSNEHEANE